MAFARGQGKLQLSHTGVVGEAYNLHDYNDRSAANVWPVEVRLTYPKRTVSQHFADPGPKRILALDGGGLRGILTLGILKQIENELRQRHGNDAGFHLCHYFDLIAGTSTGAIIGATLAIGWSVGR